MLRGLNYSSRNIYFGGNTRGKRLVKTSCYTAPNFSTAVTRKLETLHVSSEYSFNSLKIFVMKLKYLFSGLFAKKCKAHFSHSLFKNEMCVCVIMHRDGKCKKLNFVFDVILVTEDKSQVVFKTSKSCEKGTLMFIC